MPVGGTTSPFKEIAAIFLRLGTTAFGGPAAHIAMMEQEIVRRRRWLTREQFLDYLGAINLIPGRTSSRPRGRRRRRFARNRFAFSLTG